MQLPNLFIQQMHELLGNETEAFLVALSEPAPVSIRYNRIKAKPGDKINNGVAVKWYNDAYYLPERPMFTLDPLLHAGVYYVQEAASMFVSQLLSSINTPVKCLDLCAAPGGKSTLLSDCLPAGSLLVANETIRTRAFILCENISKWGNPNTVVLNNDPKDFAALPHFFDIVLIDAPCSGEGMFRKDPSAISEWSLKNIQLCAERQRRIVADAWDTLKPGGILLYSTCTYNRLENEENVRWIMNELGAELQHITLDKTWNITESDFGYRFYPHKTKGEGFFISALRKNTSQSLSSKTYKTGKNTTSRNPVPAQTQTWLQGDFIYTQEQGKIKAFSAIYHKEICQFLSHLRIIQAGVNIAEVKGKDIIPSVALALSQAFIPQTFKTAEVDLTTAQRYLKRENIPLSDFPPGFILISYKNHPLGFSKNIGTRSNNLYPSAWRIRMDL